MNRGPFSALELVAIDDSSGTLGRSGARNQGVQKAAAADAEWIFFLDADDLMLPDAFANVADLVEHYDAVWGLIASRAFGASEHHLRLPQILSINELAALLVFDPFLTLQMGHFVRTPAALATPFDAGLNAGEDFDYYLRLWQHYRCVKVPRPLFVARQGRHSQGPRRANAQDWGTAVRSRLVRERAAHALHADSPETLAIKNAAVLELQAFYRERGFADATNYLALAREMPYRGLHRIEICGAEPFTMYSDNDDPVCLSLAWTGEFRDTSTRLWRALSGSARVILDIGAGTGLWGLLAARSASAESSIYCFEPLADRYARLLKNIAANGIANITAIHTAIGRGNIETGTSAETNAGLLGSRASAFEPHRPGSHTKHATIVSVDEFMRARGAHAELVRIDVAGSELEVLSGMTSVVSANHPDILLALRPEAALTDVEQLLRATGYRCFVIDEHAARLTPVARFAAYAGQDLHTCWLTVRDDASARAVTEESGSHLVLA